MHQIEASYVKSVPDGGLKRKRVHCYNRTVCENLSDSEDATIESLNDCSSNSSTSSSVSTCSSAGSYTTFKLNKVQNGHKLLITEETMSNALKDLCMESEMCSSEANAESLIPQDEEQADHEDSGVIQLSDELKLKLKEYNTDFFSNLTHNQNNMQLVIWSPKVELLPNSDADSEVDLSSSDTSLSSNDSVKSKLVESTVAYKIEEPLDSHAKNKLKRKYSQLNKISIEELATSKHDKGKPSFYLVDQFESNNNDPDSNQNLIYLNQNQTGSQVKITEIENDQHSSSATFEPMDI